MDGSGFSAMRAQNEGVHAAHPAKLVQRPQVGVHVIHVIGVRRVVVLRGPILEQMRFSGNGREVGLVLPLVKHPFHAENTREEIIESS